MEEYLVRAAEFVHNGTFIKTIYHTLDKDRFMIICPVNKGLDIRYREVCSETDLDNFSFNILIASDVENAVEIIKQYSGDKQILFIGPKCHVHQLKER